MVKVLDLTIILAVVFIPHLKAHQIGHEHHHHDCSPEESGKLSCSGHQEHEHEHQYELEDEHEHEHEEDHGHSHSHVHHEQHGDDHDHSHPHAHHEKHSLGEEHHGGHRHGRDNKFRLAGNILEDSQFDEDHGTTGSHRHTEHEHHHHAHTLSTRGLWFRAMGSSLLVSLASLICLLLLPFIVLHGKPSKTVVDALAGFGAGSMLGDALLHQLPHAFGGPGGHSHAHGSHDHDHELGQEEHGGHAHSLEDLSVGLAVLGGILLFFMVEKIVRQADQLAVGGGHTLGHSHHHHHLKKDNKKTSEDKDAKDGTVLHQSERVSDSGSGIRRRNTTAGEEGGAAVTESEKKVGRVEAGDGRETDSDVGQDDGSRLVLGYLNLFSDGVHNFTDGMALGSAFLLHGTVGGWSRTLFLLAHELPQEVGDFGILVRSGFGVFEALAFNFLSALVALAGTALALLLGGNPGHSTLIEGFTAGGFIYIAVGAVMPDMHSQGTSFRTTICQLASLSLGMGVAIIISLAE